MTIAGFIAKNALRNKRRALLSLLSVAVSLFLFVTLLTLLRELTQPPEDVGSSLRIAVRSKVSIADTLPARQLPIIEKIPGVACVTPFTYFGGVIKDDTSVGFAQFGIDPAKMTTIFGEAKVPQEQLDAWLADRTTAIVGKDTPCEGATLEIIDVPAVLRCKTCKNEWEIEIPAFICGTCGPGAVEVATGEEFMVESIEVEDEEEAACTAPR